MTLAGYEIDDSLSLPPKHDYGIGLIGCGGIVNYAHLPAYQQHGLNLVACYDQDHAKAVKTAADHGISRVASSLADLLGDPAIDIVDIAVTPWGQASIAALAIAAGKHLLCQKPLADAYGDAVRIVDQAVAANVKVAVNQQMRWEPGIRVSKQLLDQNALGRVADARIEVSIRTPWHMWPWIAEGEQIEVMYHSIHYLDSLRFLFGDPMSVTALHNRWPDQPEVGETRTQTLLTFASGQTALVDVNHHNWSDDAYARFRWLGTEGIVTGTFGLLYDYPTGRVDTLAYQPKAEDSHWHEAALSTRWIPDAFIGPMASLMEAIQTDSEPVTSGRDNLGTLRTVFAAYRSAAEERTVRLEEING